MARVPYRRKLLRAYLMYMFFRDTFTRVEALDSYFHQFELDCTLLLLIQRIRYLRGRPKVPKAGNLHLAWHYARNPVLCSRFLTMLRLTPDSFWKLLRLIQHHEVFQTTSNRPQAPVETQLAVTLYRMGRFGNGASVSDLARIAGISEGSVEKYTERCQKAILTHHDQYVRMVSDAEKEVEKKWVERESGCVGWRDGWLMYDGTPIDLFQRPGLNGDAYWNRKCNYGINTQVGYSTVVHDTAKVFYRLGIFRQTCVL